MKNKKTIEEKNINRRDFLKKLAAGAVFTVPTIQSFSLLDSDTNPEKSWWTGHGHGHHNHTPAPPPPGY